MLFNTYLSGGEGIELEPNRAVLPDNEGFLLLIKGLLDAVEAMEKSNNNSGSLL